MPGMSEGSATRTSSLAGLVDIRFLSVSARAVAAMNSRRGAAIQSDRRSAEPVESGLQALGAVLIEPFAVREHDLARFQRDQPLDPSASLVARETQRQPQV